MSPYRLFNGFLFLLFFGRHFLVKFGVTKLFLDFYNAYLFWLCLLPRDPPEKIQEIAQQRSVTTRCDHKLSQPYARGTTLHDFRKLNPDSAGKSFLARVVPTPWCSASDRFQ